MEIFQKLLKPPVVSGIKILIVDPDELDLIQEGLKRVAEHNIQQSKDRKKSVWDRDKLKFDGQQALKLVNQIETEVKIS